MTDSNPLDALRARIIADDEVPETVRHFLEKGASLEEIRLDRHGNWWHEGEVFENARLSALFHRSLQQTARGNWVLHIEPYTYPVLVDLCAVFVVRIVEPGADESVVRLRDETTTTMDMRALYTDGDRILATRIDGRPARIVDTAYRQLTAELTERDGRYCVRVCGREHPLHPLPEDFFSQPRPMAGGE